MRTRHPVHKRLIIWIGSVLKPAVILTFGLLLPIVVRAGNVEKWHPVNLAFTSTATYSNPFQNASLSAVFTGPGNTTLTVPGFYAGGQTWKIRFSPTVEGTWTYTTTSTDANLNGQTGTITCITNSNTSVHGGLKVDSNHPHYFIYEDGTPCFWLSFEADWLAEMDFGDTNVTKAKSLIDIYRTNGFNGVLMQVYAYDTSWEPGNTSAYDFGPPAQILSLGTVGSPDWSHLNTNYLNNLDGVVDYLFQKGVAAHIMLRVYNKGVTWPANSSTYDNFFWSYLVARYQAFPNIVWDFSKEGYREKDDAYVNATLLRIKAADAYYRMVTIHDDTSFYSNVAYANNCDFRTYQTNGGYNAMIAARNARNWPVLQAEDKNYQVGNDGGSTYTGHSTAADTLTGAIECIMAGAGMNFYYTYHAWDVVRYNETPNGLSAYKNLASFFNGTAWNSLAPNDSLINSPGIGRHCLAIPGSEYAVYLTNGSVNLTISGAPAGNPLVANWLNVATGATTSLPNTGNGTPSFTNPWSQPALLHITLPPATNTPPILAAISNQTLIAGQTLMFTNLASDSDLPVQTLAFSLPNPPAGAAINPNDGVFTWRPTIAQSPSTNLINVVVTDNGAPPLSATQSFTVIVSQPTKPSIGGTSVSNGLFYFTVTGDGGPDYTIYGSSNLVDWLPIWTNTASVPPFTFTDSATNANQRFYRVLLGP